MNKSGFTLIEVLVASVLFSIVMVTMSMVFSSSAVAWRIGRAGVKGMHEMRHSFSSQQLMADNALPKLRGQSGVAYVRSMWVGSGGGLTDADGRGGSTMRGFADGSHFGKYNPNLSSSEAVKSPISGSSISGNNVESYTIRAGSAGPDREWGTEDDIIAGPREDRGGV